MCDKTCKCQPEQKRSRRFEMMGERLIGGRWQTIPVGHGVAFPDGTGVYKYIDPTNESSSTTVLIDKLATWAKAYRSEDINWLD